MGWLVFLVAAIVVLAVVLWPLTLGRRYFAGEKKGWASIRRDLYSNSYDEGIYPLDPSADDAERKGRTDRG